MKYFVSRFSLFVVVLLSTVTALAQEMLVKSFGVAQGDMFAASPIYGRKDVNGNKCALIKVKLPLQDVKFEGGIVGDVRYVAGMYWVYMGQRNRQLKIKHNDYHPLMITFADYGVERVDSATTYNLSIRLTQEAAAGQLGNSSAPDVLSVDVYDVVFEMVRVKGGTFTMGTSSQEETSFDDYAKPAHKVTLNDYYIAKTEITQELWETVMRHNPSGYGYSGSFRPVGNISWNDCQEFIKKLNILTGKNFRLPTEAEWEYAARGGKKSRGYRYSGGDDLDSVAWYYETAFPGQINGREYGPQPVATKSPNELGLYDMSGNMLEWCSDWFDDYNNRSQKNPKGPATGTKRVLRGSNFLDRIYHCRLCERHFEEPDSRDFRNGARLALDLR